VTDWDACEHDWVIFQGTWIVNDDRREEVRCRHCGCPGERWVDTGEVDWPTT
jgi:hypothetical protein